MATTRATQQKRERGSDDGVPQAPEVGYAPIIRTAIHAGAANHDLLRFLRCGAILLGDAVPRPCKWRDASDEEVARGRRCTALLPDRFPYRLRIVKGSAAVKCAEPIGSASDSGCCDGCHDGQGGHRCTGSEPDGMFPPFGGIQCHPEPLGSIGPFLQVGVSPNVVREAAILRFVGLVYIVQHGVRCLVCVVRRELYYVVGSSAIPTSSRSDPSTK